MNSLNTIYNQKSYNQKHKLEIKFKNYNDTFTLDLVGNDQKPDCCIGHFGYNFYFRTKKGLNYEKYKTIKTMFNAIKRKSKELDLICEGLYLIKNDKKRLILC